MKGIHTVLIAILVILVVVLIAKFSLDDQKTIVSQELNTGVETEKTQGTSAKEMLEQLNQQEIIVEADVEETEEEEVIEEPEEVIEETPNEPSPECVLLSRRAQKKLEEAEEEVEDLEDELKEIEDSIEYEEDRDPKDTEKIELLEIDEENIEDDLSEAKTALHDRQGDMEELEKQCGEIVYLE